MPRITWNADGERLYEAGVDRGVLYVTGQPGVAWNGLTSVSESADGGETKSYYIDGVKYLDTSSPEELKVSINAYTYPEAFAQCDGTAVAFSGVFVSQQKRKSFGLAYRTKIGNDLEGLNHGYKIHLLYGCLASPSEQNYNTESQELEPTVFSWNCSTKPIAVGRGFRPTAHITIDSRSIPEQALQILEDRLYGTDVVQAYLPPPKELFELFTVVPGAVYSITLNTVTGISLLVPSVPGDLLETVDEGLFVLTDTSHLSDVDADGIYIWEA